MTVSAAVCPDCRCGSARPASSISSHGLQIERPDGAAPRAEVDALVSAAAEGDFAARQLLDDVAFQITFPSRTSCA